MKLFLITILSFFIMNPVNHALPPFPLGETQEQELSMFFIGDIMCHDPQFISCKTADGYDFSGWFEYMIPLFESADFAVANLETTVTDDGNYSGYPCFRTPHSIIYDIKKSGIDVLVNANNHSLDGGKKAVEFGIDTMEDAGLMHVGTCREEEDNLPLIIEKNGIKIGIIASTYGANGLTLPEGKEHMLNFNHDIDLEKNLSYLKEQKVDGVLYFVHWGDEYQRQFSEEQSQFARKLFDSGVNWIIGSHPHVIQGAEFFPEKNNYVVYSLGNAVSNQTWRYSDTGFGTKLYFKKNGRKGLKLVKAEHHPFWVDKFDERGIVDYKIIPIKEGELPEAARISNEDKGRISQALSDFKELYPEDLIVKDESLKK